MQEAGVMSHLVRCWECGIEVSDPMVDACPRCGGLLDISVDLSAIAGSHPYSLLRGRGVWRYAPFLPLDASRAVSLREGDTPLYRCPSLADEIGVGELRVKYEGANPTGSFKDRGMTVGVTRALELGVDTVGCASTGNTSASLAAYAAKAGLQCVVLLPEGKVAAGKLAQAMFYGARIISIDGSFDDALRLVKQLSREGMLYLLNSINPYRPEGQKTAGFEIMEQMGYRVPDTIILPVGNAGNIWSVYKALRELEEVGWISSLPRLIGVQAEGASPIVTAFQEGAEDFVPVDEPETVATAIRIGNPVSGRKALRAIYDTGGLALQVSDEEIMGAQSRLGRMEGIGVEPASAASIAGLMRLREEGLISSDERVVCVCTGNLLKDPEAVMMGFGGMRSAPAELEAVKKAML